jgi:hypothetical protein
VPSGIAEIGARTEHRRQSAPASLNDQLIERGMQA